MELLKLVDRHINLAREDGKSPRRLGGSEPTLDPDPACRSRQILQLIAHVPSNGGEIGHDLLELYSRLREVAKGRGYPLYLADDGGELDGAYRSGDIACRRGALVPHTRELLSRLLRILAKLLGSLLSLLDLGDKSPLGISSSFGGLGCLLGGTLCRSGCCLAGLHDLRLDLADLCGKVLCCA